MTEFCKNFEFKFPCSDLTSTYRYLFAVNKRKSVIPVRYLINNSAQARTKRKLNRKTKICPSKKKKIDSTEEDDYCESESDALREKYFKDLPWMCTSCEEVWQYTFFSVHFEKKLVLTFLGDDSKLIWRQS